MKRVGIVGVFHETNSFSEHGTDRESFRPRWYLGEEFTTAFAGSRTVGGGFLDGNAEHGVESVPLFGAYATPSGQITASTFADILSAIRTTLEPTAPELDGILLELHGDMDVELVSDPEETITALVRELVGTLPIVAVLDFHTNMSRPRLAQADLLVGYRENPHIDTYDRGREAAAHLARLLRGEAAPARAHRGLAIVAPPVAQRTTIEPFATITARARQLAAHPAVWSVNVHGGYAYLDASYTGIGFTAFADAGSGELADSIVAELSTLTTTLAPTLVKEYPSPESAVATALEGAGVCAIVDTGDNINGGSPGDTTWLAHAARTYAPARFLTTICDPTAIEQLRDVPIGESAAVSIGGWAGESAGAPLVGTATVVGRSAGVFVNEGPMATGATIDMGAACWVRLDNIDIVLQQRASQPNDPQMFLHLGIDPRGYDAVMLKGAAAVRAGWAPYVDGFVDAGTRGETDSVLDRLPYTAFERGPRAH
ncbi:M81 family metallopeptidase [Microbacterium saperdae]|uniref:Microcystin degradation protein MlrC n=1 Tax=Microbacterium saperdae TaxID=69368 RepID=A0A543BA00_9MICO|nr:M81 family metallopeptidase [Microbacterium saperdae]TQL81616.1 microcystin degradation protein MlrC [Microbacterium saperdae]GGM33441.1 microcystinase C [Microbacterium saperdae]